VYRDDCEHYESEEDMSEVGVEIVKTEETEESGIKYLNINVSNSEVERNPDVVRLCADAGILEYVKPSGDAISRQAVLDIINFEDKWLVHAKGNNAYTEVAFSGMKSRIADLPPVNPQEPKTGHWILDETDNSITCDKCGCLIWANDISNGEAYYCPNCGAGMESEDKE
jgi:predicted RNA-binding Zn-ribbon protein involved in translation (DUF1610 family)